MRPCLLSVAAILALASAVCADEPPKPNFVTKVFTVADLVTPMNDLCVTAKMLTVANPAQRAECYKKVATVSECGESLVKLVTSMVRPYSWNTVDGPGSVEFFEIGTALVVKNTPDVLREVNDLLEALRRMQGVSISSEVRLVRVPAGFCDRVGVKPASTACLTECELAKLLEAAQGHAQATVTQLPRVTTFDGQTATVRTGDQRMFVTGVEATRVKGSTVLVSKNTSIDLGETLALCGQVSADGKYVKLRANLTHTQLASENVEMVPVVTQITPVFEGGSHGTPVPFTQYIQAPEVQTKTIEKTIVMPCGGTAVLGSWKEAAGQPALTKIPELKRLYKNAGLAAECEVIALATVRVVRGECTEKAPPAPAPAPTVIKLRNIAAADAAQAVTKFLDNKQQRAMLTFDAATNTIYLGVEGGAGQQAVKLLAAMDVAPPQVQIQALVMQVPAGFLADIGFTDDAPGNPVMTLTPRELNILNAQIRQAKSRVAVDILSRPQLCVADNQTGFVQVGQNFPYVTASHTDGTGVATQKIAHEHVGLTLRVTPRINPDGKVLLRAEPSLTSVTPAVSLGNGTYAPAFNTQSMKATVLTTDGQTVVIGGLIERRDRVQPDDGPFTALAKQAAGPELRETIVILTPHIIREAQPVVVPAGRTVAAPGHPATPPMPPVVPPTLAPAGNQKR